MRASPVSVLVTFEVGPREAYGSVEICVHDALVLGEIPGGCVLKTS